MKSLPGTSFTAQNIFCIGRNFFEHAKELNNPIPSTPVVFTKPTSALCFDGDNLIIPRESTRVDHEVEIVLVIGKTAKNLSEDVAHEYISHLGIGLDFTARDLQEKAKEESLPWSVSKGFDTFAAVSRFQVFDGDLGILTSLNFSLEVNGEVRQMGSSKEMIFTIPKIISYLSGIFTLSPGDVIFTGTPSGVGPLKSGDKMVAKLEGWATLALGVQSA